MRKILIVALILVCASPAFAGKEGTSGAQFLKIGVGARAAAMGDAYDSVASNAEAIFWNPSGLAGVQNHSISVSDNEWIADTRVISGAYAKRFGFGTFGVGVHYLMYGEMEETTVGNPDGTGRMFSSSDMAISVGMGRSLTDRFSVGGAAKIIRLNIDDVNSMGVCFDVGTQYMTGFRTLNMSIALQNLGPEMKYGGTYLELPRDKTQDRVEEEFEQFSLPVIVRLGLSYTFFDNLILAVQGVHPNDGAERLDVGGEYWIANMIAIRGGYKYNYDAAEFAGGVGVQFSPLSVDAAYTGMGRLDYALRLTVGADF
jgi:hypothetical protein